MARAFLTDAMWDKVTPLLTPEHGGMGRPYQPHRPWIEAIVWRHQTGAPWRDVLEEHGSWRSIACRFNWWG